MLSRLLGDVILRPDARGLWRSFGAIWACCLRMFLQWCREGDFVFTKHRRRPGGRVNCTDPLMWPGSAVTAQALH